MKSYEYYEKIAHLYDQMYEDEEWTILRQAVQIYIENVIGSLSGKVLDVGTGTGYWLNFFLKKNFQVYAIEPSKKMLEIAKRKYKDKVKFFNTKIEEFEFEDRFDILNLQGDVLSYIEDLDFVMKKMKNLVKNKGYIFATVDSFYFMRRQIIKYGNLKELRDFDRTHITTVGSQYGTFKSRCFTVEDILNLKRYGFEVIDIRGCGLSKVLSEELKNSYLIKEAEHIFFALRKL
ncbi:methyltransferase type 11 [Thermosipho sp. 1063]|uniref:class I SAM-dependent methyltransferase n=1 Tax=unclassified Thermosipho (in: thermotogales) TaxID=2676525 RepID=UPI000949380E|nr:MULTISPECIES: class I SAM-dependent methyltransferase [unclassified Thermosipho (in: thermotogales)]ANQ54423.1 type 11 methyltransferase [Thermosipho sp. 1070]APT72867.1 methyltransferase type 11 [Thermosipho sp. 1063]